MASCLTARFRFAEVYSVTVYGKHHIAGLVDDDCILVGGRLVEEGMRFYDCFFGGFGLC